ncbi:high affinity copper uptake protein 1-like isoform X4 [Homarus americanus]|uniref:high affinity copper uptake protein 1-like isoform X4 n=1 Tax=Homarus americanus TaxID=6706 RepID=UPI001C4687E8|nr:high affinity copper uptake protein 1-like isoform X4 [Homarus americanus]
MHMSYFFSSTVYDFLFKGVNIVTTWGMVSLCLGLVSLSVLAEGFKVARSQLLKVATSRRTGCSKYEIPERVKFHILQSFFHVLHLIIGYILMLVVMTYNAYFTIAVVAGAGLGYFFFAVFDLPSKLLGSYHSPLPKDPPNFTCGSEGMLLQAPNGEKQADDCLHNSDHVLCSKDENLSNEDKGKQERCCEEDCTPVEHTTLSVVQAPDTLNPV